MKARGLLVFVGMTLLFGVAAEAEPAYRGWGPRVGIADDPDQGVFGVHFDLGELHRQVRFVPSAELGIGDDHTILALTAPALYRWERLRETEIVPYAGGGVTAALVEIDRDRGRDDDTEFEMALKAIGGAEWKLRNRKKFFLELHLVFGDVHDIEVLAGWTFSR